MFTGPAEAASADPRGQLDGLFVQLEIMVGLPEFRGCPFVNASSELADPAHPAHESSAGTRSGCAGGSAAARRDAGAADPERSPAS